MMNNEQQYQDLLKKLTTFFTEEMEFLKSFQLKVRYFDSEKLELQFPMRTCLQGNMMRGILHGGVAATVLDSAGGMLAMAANFAKDKSLSIDKQLDRIAKTATVDLRVDYLYPGRGEFFLTESEIVRAGRHITVVQSRLFNDQKTLLALAVASYIVPSI